MNRTNTLLRSVLRQAEAEAGVEGAAPETAEQKAKRAAASNFLSIVRGRLPLIFVHALRFDKTLLAMSNKDAASKFATSVGKVFDIRKNRNFSYVGEAFKPTAEDVTAAQGWVDAVGAENAKGLKAVGDKTLMQNVLDTYKAAGLATAEEAAAFASARGATRTVGVKKEAASGGAPKADEVQGKANAADDLLS